MKKNEQRPSTRAGMPAFGQPIIGAPQTTHVTNITNHVHNDLGREITQLSKAARNVLHGTDPATRKAILLLIAHTCDVKQKDVKKVLNAVSELQRKYAP